MRGVHVETMSWFQEDAGRSLPTSVNAATMSHNRNRVGSETSSAMSTPRGNALATNPPSGTNGFNHPSTGYDASDSEESPRGRVPVRNHTSSNFFFSTSGQPTNDENNVLYRSAEDPPEPDMSAPWTDGSENLSSEPAHTAQRIPNEGSESGSRMTMEEPYQSNGLEQTEPDTRGFADPSLYVLMPEHMETLVLKQKWETDGLYGVGMLVSDAAPHVVQEITQLLDPSRRNMGPELSIGDTLCSVENFPVEWVSFSCPG
jgi:hypothetical protein